MRSGDALVPLAMPRLGPVRGIGLKAPLVIAPRSETVAARRWWMACTVSGASVVSLRCSVRSFTALRARRTRARPASGGMGLRLRSKVVRLGWLVATRATRWTVSAWSMPTSLRSRTSTVTDDSAIESSRDTARGLPRKLTVGRAAMVSRPPPGSPLPCPPLPERLEAGDGSYRPETKKRKDRRTGMPCRSGFASSRRSC
mmetsp:Transcript_15627/g.48393  ORF Transcript_15627/g.48393 Transcript_15627/m.48393 type:complete len:200 (-) Transcript_15627:852-1451(-)